jgi:RHS repeat-associated protein
MGVGPINGSANWTTQYGYDASGRLSTVLDNNVSATSPFTYAYQNGTNWISGRSNADGSAVINQYDILGRLTQVSAANAAGSGINTYGYSYDAAGQRTQEASSVGTRNFAYDNQRELTGSTNVNGSNQPIISSEYSYLYDSIGNMQKKTTSAGELDFTANNLNQYTQLSGAAQPTPLTPQYDANGNMTSDGNGHTYLYDEENRLLEVDNATAVNGVVKTVNVYDGLSRRVEKDTYASGNSLLSATRYLYDGSLPIAEYDVTNTVTLTYTRGLDLSGTMQGAGGIGGLLAMTNASGQSYSYFCDGNGNVVDLTDSYGNSAAHYQYDPFGNVISSRGSLQQLYQWSSKETDAGTGLVYYLYRFYDPALGRWTSRDPLEEDGSINLYEFVDNAIPGEFDPSGAAPRSVPLNGLSPSDPSWVDQTSGNLSSRNNNTAFFDRKYAGWVAHEKEAFTDLINSIVSTFCQTRPPGIKDITHTDLVTADLNHKLDPKTGDYHNLKRGQSPNETLYGDTPQDAWSADKVLGDFTFGLEPTFRKGEAKITWQYIGCCSDGTPFYSWTWQANLAVYDQKGLQPTDHWYHWYLAPGVTTPSRIVQMGSWPLTGTGKCKCAGQ